MLLTFVRFPRSRLTFEISAEGRSTDARLKARQHTPPALCRLRISSFGVCTDNLRILAHHPFVRRVARGRRHVMGMGVGNRATSVCTRRVIFWRVLAQFQRVAPVALPMEAAYRRWRIPARHLCQRSYCSSYRRLATGNCEYLTSSRAGTYSGAL